MSNKLFNAELRDCARVNEAVSIEEQHRIAMEAAENRTYTAEELEMYESLIEAEEEYEWEEVESDELDELDLKVAQAEWEAEQDAPFAFMECDDPDYWG